MEVNRNEINLGGTTSNLKRKKKKNLLKEKTRDFPGIPVVKTFTIRSWVPSLAGEL